MATIKKAQNGTKAKPVPTPRIRQVADSLDNEAARKTRLMYRQTEQNKGAATDESVKNYKSSSKDKSNADRYRKLADVAEKKKKMKNGGSLTGLKASNKRVGPVDPKGAFTKVQKKTLAGAKGKAKLTADKQLGATKMTAKRGMKISKKK